MHIGVVSLPDAMDSMTLFSSFGLAVSSATGDSSPLPLQIQR
jgi:hypothetical protein